MRREARRAHRLARLAYLIERRLLRQAQERVARDTRDNAGDQRAVVGARLGSHVTPVVAGLAVDKELDRRGLERRRVLLRIVHDDIEHLGLDTGLDRLGLELRELQRLEGFPLEVGPDRRRGLRPRSGALGCAFPLLVFRLAHIPRVCGYSLAILSCVWSSSQAGGPRGRACSTFGGEGGVRGAPSMHVRIEGRPAG